MMGSQHSGTLTFPGIDAAVESAVQKVLGELPPEQRRETLKRLRRELHQCLTEAPGGSAAVQDLKLRSQLAASFSRHLGPPEGGD